MAATIRGGYEWGYEGLIWLYYYEIMTHLQPPKLSTSTKETMHLLLMPNRIFDRLSPTVISRLRF